MSTLSISNLKKLVKHNFPESEPQAYFLDRQGRWQSSDSSFAVLPPHVLAPVQQAPKGPNLIYTDISGHDDKSRFRGLRAKFEEKFPGHPKITVLCHDCGYPMEVPCVCRTWRLCEFCLAREVRRLWSKYIQRVASVPTSRLRLVTLTKVNEDSLTPETISRIRKEFKKLTHLAVYRDKIEGYLYTIEVINTGKGWHVHIHAIVAVKLTGDLLGHRKDRRHTADEERLSFDWQEITDGRGKIVNITNASNHRGTLNYLLKYLSKIPQINGLDHEYLAALHGCRTLSVGGGWYDADDLKPEKILCFCPECFSPNWIPEFLIRKAEYPEFTRGP